LQIEPFRAVLEGISNVKTASANIRASAFAGAVFGSSATGTGLL
jgi:hypothetical protein